MKTIEEITPEIIMLHDAIKQNPDDEKSKNSLESTLKAWYNQLDITVFIAQNEQLPWDSTDLNFKTRPMPPKATVGFQQTGDYQFHMGNLGGKFVDGFGGLLVERKGGIQGCEDLYGTLFSTNKKTGSKNRDRFYREIERFHKDPRFTDFFIFVESDLITWLNYRPPNSNSADIMLNQKLAVLASLEARGAHVVWCGSRKVACRMYRDFVKQYCLKNYTRILKLDETKDNNKAVKYFDND